MVLAAIGIFASQVLFYAVRSFAAFSLSTRCASEAQTAIQILLQFSTGTIQISMAADSNCRMLKKVVFRQLKARGWPRASFRIQFDDKVLSDDSASLADIRLISGSTVQVNLYCLRGGVGTSKFKMSDALREDLKKTQSGKHGKYSLTRQGLAELFRRLLPVARQRGYTKDDLSSHDCAALFQGKAWKDGEWAADKDPRLQFHPMDRFPELYSDRMPDRMISYAWAGFMLMADLPLFLDASEEMAPTSADGGTTTYWLDIFFTCQNSPDIKLYLSIADGLYSRAELHLAFLCGGMVQRAWCIAEMVTRFIAGLRAHGRWGEGQDRTDAVIRGGELLAEGDRAFTTFVTVNGRTDLNKDMMAGVADRFESMEAFDANDLKEIQGKTLAVFGSAAAFNFAMAVVRSAVLSYYADRHPVRASRCVSIALCTPPAHPGTPAGRLRAAPRTGLPTLRAALPY